MGNSWEMGLNIGLRALFDDMYDWTIIQEKRRKVNGMEAYTYITNYESSCECFNKCYTFVFMCECVCCLCIGVSTLCLLMHIAFLCRS